jgi:hypothetical protein
MAELTPWSTALLEKLTAPKLIKKTKQNLPTFNRT